MGRQWTGKQHGIKIHIKKNILITVVYISKYNMVLHHFQIIKKQPNTTNSNQNKTNQTEVKYVTQMGVWHNKVADNSTLFLR